MRRSSDLSAFALWPHNGQQPKTINGKARQRRKRDLPQEFHAELADARIARRSNNAEIVATEITARIPELCVVEHVEEFSSKLECEGFGEPRAFQYREIRV